MKKRIRLLSVVLLLATLSLCASDLWSASLEDFGFRTFGKGDAVENSVVGKQPLTQSQSQHSKEKPKGYPLSDTVVLKGVVRIKLTEEAVGKVENKAGKSRMIETRSAARPMNVGITTLNAKLEWAKATKMKRVFPYHPRFEARQRAEGLHLWYELEVDNTQSAIEICKQLATDASVKIAEPILKKVSFDIKGTKQQGETVTKSRNILSTTPVYVRDGQGLSSRTSRVPFAASARKWEDNPPVDDPYLLLQWHYYNYGQIFNDNMPNSYREADIDLFDAWQVTMGDPRVIVSVHDEGVDYTHPDLKDNMWVNEAELNGTPGVDDDGNGYVDDIHGYNFRANGPIHPGNHGSHVAGTIAASNNNGIGVAGIAGGDGEKRGVRIMSCQIIDNTDNSSEGGVSAASYVYAANNGAVISQNSWGYNVFDYYDQADLDGIDYFIKYAGKDENGKPLAGTPMVGGIVIFSAGNDGSNGAKYPGYYEKVMAVAATGPWNERTSYTNYSDWVDIAAPGGDMNIMAEAGVLSCVLDQGYTYMQGTSMACPHVSGVAALILSKFGHESYTPEMLWNRLITSAVPWSELDKKQVGVLGVGLLNAARAVQSDNLVAPDSIGNLNVATVGYDFVDITFTAPKDKDNGSAHAYEVRYSKEPLTEENVLKAEVLFQLAQKAGTKEHIMVDGLLGQSTYYIAVRATDLWGNRSVLSNRVTATTTEAPRMTVTPDTIKIEIANAAINPIGEGEIKITNGERGTLRYSMKSAVTFTPEVGNDIYQLYSNIDDHENHPFSGKIGEDGSARFLAATRFDVKKKPFIVTFIKAAVVPDGVLLTDNTRIGYDSDPFEIKIYQGGKTPAEGKLVSRSSAVVPTKQYMLNYQQDLYFTLATPVRFEPGESFWVVLDFPKGYYQPLRMNSGTKSPSGCELFSNDDKEWTDLNKLQISNLEKNYAYRIFALTDLKDMPDNLITFQPGAGMVAGGAEQNVNVKVNVKMLVEGNFAGYANVLSNDPVCPFKRVHIDFKVKGQRAGIRSVPTLTVGSAVQGYTKEAELVVYNDSLGVLRIDTVLSSLPQFTVKLKLKDNKKNLTSAKIVRGDSATYMVTFRAPLPAADPTHTSDSIGNFVSRLTFKTNAANVTGGDYNVAVDGLSIERPVFVIDKAIETLDLKMGETKTVTLNIKNEGKYRLDYSIDKDQIAKYDYSDVNPRVKEYFATRVEKGGSFAYIAQPANEITQEIRGSLWKVVPLPFSFSSYGVKYDTITIYGDSKICLGNRKDLKYWSSGAIGTNTEPATIFPIYFGGRNSVSERGGKAYLKIESDKVTIEYTAYGHISPGGPKSDWLRVQTVIYANGKIDFVYKFVGNPAPDIEAEPTPDYGVTGLIGISDAEGEGGLGVWFCRPNTRNDRRDWKQAGIGELRGWWEGSIFMENGIADTLESKVFPPFLEKNQTLLVKIEPNRVFAKEVTPASGYLLPGESVNVALNLKMDEELTEGEYLRTFAIHTNDPLAKDTSFVAKINWQTEMRPVLDQSEINYGNVGKEVGIEREVVLRNKGGKPFKVTARLESGANFKLVSPIGTTNCKGLSSIAYTVEFKPMAEIDYSDRLIIEIEGDPVPMGVPLRGRGIKRPLLSVLPTTAMNFKMNLKDSKLYVDTAVILENKGDELLKYHLATSDWIKQIGIAPMAGMSKAGYFWSDNYIDQAVGYNWEWVNPTKFNPLGKVDGVFMYDKEFELPWPFPYYGETFTKCYINMSGMIHFSREDIEYTMLCNTSLGDNILIPQSGDGVNGFIAPLGGALDVPLCYHEEIGEGDDKRVVFTWSMRDLWDKQDTCRAVYQAILYPDGRIKFQYKDVEKANWRGKKTIGIENRTGDDGLSIAYSNKPYIKDGLAIMITPSTPETLKPGERRRVALRVTPEGIWDGQNKGVVRIQTNEQSNAKKEVKVNLALTGETRVEYSYQGKTTNVVDLGKIYRYDFPIEHHNIKGDKYAYSTIGAKSVIDVKLSNAGAKETNLYREKMSGFSDNFPGNPIRDFPVVIKPKQEWMLRLGLDMTPLPVRLQPGEHTLKFIVQDRCPMSNELTCKEAGYTIVGEEQGMFGPIKIYYKADTIKVLADLYDVPNEQMTVDTTVFEVALNNREEKGGTEFTVSNLALQSDFWRKMQGNETLSELVRQSSLDYQIVLEDLSRAEYETLLKGEKKKTMKATDYPQAPVIANFVSYAYQAESIATYATESSSYVDSLGYFNFKAYYNGFTANGPGQKFISYTRYRTGSEGFNLTNVQAMMAKMTKYPEEGFDYEVKVFLGKELKDADEIYSQTATLNIAKDKKFEMQNVELKEPVYIYPNQDFWIGIVNKNNTMVSTVYWEATDWNVELMNQFMVDNEAIFAVLAQATQGYYGWGMFCYSDQKRENPTRWISLDRMEGSVPVNESHKISVNIDPSKDLNRLNTRYARISINSNDPYPFGRDTTMRFDQPIYDANGHLADFTDFVKDRGYMLVRMRINQAPEFVGTKARMTLQENVDSTFIVKVLDVEGDEVKGLTVALDSAYGVDKAHNVLPVVEIVKATGKDTLSFPVRIKTNFESSGNYAFAFKTMDSRNQERGYHLTLAVTNVNRAPIVVGETVAVISKEITKEVNLNRLFTDPDRQVLEYTAEAEDNNLIAVTVADSMLYLHGWQESASKVKVTAMDPEGASKNVVLSVTVIPENPALKSTSISAYPNPVVDVLNCDFALNQRSEIEVRIFGTDGRLCYQSGKTGYGEGKHHTTINVGSLSGGIYILQYVVDGTVKDTQKFVK